MNILLLCAYYLAYAQISKSLTCLKQHNTQIVRYDDPKKRLPELVESASKILRPDIIIYAGVNGGLAKPTIEELFTVKKMGVPFVLLSPECSSDYWWWGNLDEYKKTKVFDLIVNIDGNTTWPGSEDGLTLLAPYDPSIWMPRKDFNSRSILCGYSGVHATPRLDIIKSVGATLFISSIYPRPYANDDDMDLTFTEYVSFLRNCKSGLNFALQGGGGGFHVKGRVIEIGLAGAVLIEDARSQISSWFTRGVDYLDYLTSSDIIQHLEWIKNNPEDAEKMALSLHNRVLKEHSPEVFWKKVFDRLKLTN